MSARPPSIRLYEFDGTNLIPEPAADYVRAAQPAALADRPSDAEPPGRLQVRSGTFQNAWRPTITQFLFSNNVNPGGKYQIFGTQFNGLSQANAFGDEFQVATNFPLVRITNNATGDVSYARTYNFSTMARGDRLRHRFNLVRRCPQISRRATASWRWSPTASHPCRCPSLSSEG